jgi:hypothetical protein
MTLSINRPALLASAAAAIAVAGCGSSGTLSRNALVNKADPICASENAQSKAVQRPTGRDANAIATYFDKLIPIADMGTSQLEKLKPDSSAASDWNAYLTARKSAINLLKTIDQKAHSRDASGLQNLVQVQSTAARVKQTASKLGATQCAM